jgi:hypothetical protein
MIEDFPGVGFLRPLSSSVLNLGLWFLGPPDMAEKTARDTFKGYVKVDDK